MNKALTNQKIHALLDAMGRKFIDSDEVVEIALYGGAALMLRFGLRDATHDVDMTPISGHRDAIMDAAAVIAAQHDMPEDWLNDHVEIFTSSRPCFDLLGDFPRGLPDGQCGLRVFTAAPEYIFAMKVLSMRSPFESSDMKDIWDLMDVIGLDSLQAARELTLQFYPDAELPRRTDVILNDLLEAKKAGSAYTPMMAW